MPGRILLLFFLTLIPLLLGSGFVMPEEADPYTPLFRWCAGWAVLYGLFYLPALICTLAHTSLSFLSLVYAALLGAALGVAVYFLKKRGEGLFAGTGALIRGLTWTELVSGALVVLHAFVAFHYMHIDDDDFSYVGTAATSWVTDTLMVYNGGTGMLLKDYAADGMNRLAAAPQFAFYAFLSKMSGIGPAVLCHTLLPPVFTVLFFTAFLMAGRVLCGDDRKKCGLFLLFVFVICAFSNVSVFSAGSFLMIRSWQGKAQIVGLILPLLICFWTRMAGNGLFRARDSLFLVLILAAAALQTAMGAVLAAMAAGLFMLMTAFVRRDLKVVGKTLPAFAIPLLCALVYLKLN